MRFGDGVAAGNVVRDGSVAGALDPSGGGEAALASLARRLGTMAAAAAATATMPGADSNANGSLDGGGGGHGEGEEGEAAESFERLTLGVLFTTMLIFLGGTFFMTYRSRIPLPYTVVLFLYGIVVGAVAELIAPEVAVALGQIPPELLFYIFLPVLIFEGSFAMNVHALRRVFFQTMLLATVGIVINTALLGAAVKCVYSDWTWYAAFLLGSLLSATDPVAVVTLLKGLRVEKHITALVDGEAVMNDGTAIIVFTFLLPAAKVGRLTDPVWLMLLKAIRLSVLPVVIGPVFGFLQSFWLRRAKDGLTRACVTVSVTYVSYYVAAHWVGASGVLTLFFQGVFLSYYCPSLFPGVEGGNLISSTWEFLVHIGNTMLFSLVGVILVADVVHTIEFTDIVVIVGLYLAMVVARLVMLEALLPVLNRFPYKMDQKTVLLLVHSGLRGGVAATLALAVQQSGLKEGVAILKVTCGVVLLTLLVNATTAAGVVRRLGFQSKEEFRVRQLQYAMECLYTTEEKALDRVKRDTKYRNANWISVEKYVGKWLRNPFAGMEIIPEAGGDDVALNRLLMTAFKTALWRQRDEHVVSETVVMELGQVIVRMIESGTLFHIRKMDLYHRRRVVEIGRAGRGGAAAATEVVIDDEAGASVLTPSLGANTGGSGSGHFLPPRTPSHPPTVVEDAHQLRRGGGPGTRLQDDEDLPDPMEQRPFPPLKTPQTMATNDTVSFLGSGPSSPNGAVGAGGRSFSHPFRGEGGGADDAPASREAAGTVSAADAAAAAAEDETDARVEALMGRLLPAWVVFAERFVFGKGYFAAAHRRAQENAFMTLLAVVKCITALSTIKYQYARTPAQARRVERWIARELADGNAAIRFFYSHFPEATNTVASSRAVLSVVNKLEEAIEQLHDEQGMGARVEELLQGMTENMRENIPERWENNAPQKQNDLVTQAVAATTLGKGLRKAEINVIATMGLVKTFAEYDTITLPENAFLIVVFGSLRALHSRWTTLNEYEWMESFGDTVGLETLLLPKELGRDRQRQWQVISTEATVLLISFNSVKPFLWERSLRSVKALWRATAVAVVLPLIETMVTPRVANAENAREHLTGVVAMGKPLIGPEECARFDFGSQFHLCFYLRGSDVAGFFNGHTPPCYISAFYASQLVWRDPEVVLYAVPMNINDSGYVPWEAAAAAAAAAAATATAGGGGGGGAVVEKRSSASRGGSGSSGGASASTAAEASGAEELLPGAADQEEPGEGEVEGEEDAADGGPATVVVVQEPGSTYADAASMLNSILRGHVPPRLGRSSASAAGEAAGVHSDNDDDDDEHEEEGEHGRGRDAAYRRRGHRSGSRSPRHQQEMDSTQALNVAVLSGFGDTAAVAAAAASSPTRLSSYVSIPHIPHMDTPAERSLVLDGGAAHPSAAANGSRRRGAEAKATLAMPPIGPACVLQRLSDFVTPVPYVNMLFAQYAEKLEMLCLAALRYLRYPGDALQVAHAQRTAERTLEFLLGFAVELALLRRAAAVLLPTPAPTPTANQQTGEEEGMGLRVSPTRPPSSSVSHSPPPPTVLLSLDGEQGDGEVIDADFQCKVCAWARQAASTKKFHLKMLIMEMNSFANRRFPCYVAALREAAQRHTQLTAVESVEGMQRMLRRLERAS